MNIAFPALIIFFLTVPGVLARRAYLATFFEQESPSLREFSTEAPYALLAAFPLNGIWYLIASRTICPFFNVRIRLDSLVLALSGGLKETDTMVGSAVSGFTDFPSYILGYFIGLYIFSYLVGGPLTGKMVSKFGLINTTALNLSTVIP